MKSFLSILLFWGLLLPTWTSAQTAEQDSLLQLITNVERDSTKARLLIELSKSYKRSDWRKEYQYANEALDLLRDKDYKKLKASALHALGTSHLHKDEPSDSALMYFEQGLFLAQETNFVAAEADIYIGYGAFYHQTGVYDKAFDNYQRAVVIAENENLKPSLCRALNNMAGILVLEDKDEKPWLIMTEP